MKKRLSLTIFLIVFSSTTVFGGEHEQERVICYGYAESCHQWQMGCFQDLLEAESNCQKNAENKCLDLGYNKKVPIGFLSCKSGLLRPGYGYTECRGAFRCEQ